MQLWRWLMTLDGGGAFYPAALAAVPLANVLPAITLLHCSRPCSCSLQAEEELPERLIGSVRFEHLDLKTAAYLDDESGRIHKNEKFHAPS